MMELCGCLIVPVTSSYSAYAAKDGTLPLQTIPTGNTRGKEFLRTKDGHFLSEAALAVVNVAALRLLGSVSLRDVDSYDTRIFSSGRYRDYRSPLVIN